jgi:hypothetical protein
VRAPSLLLGAVLGAAAIAACSSAPPMPEDRAPPTAPRWVGSNVLRRDHAGSASCTRCHAEIAKHWDHAAMKRMTRSATGEDVKAPFDGRGLSLGDDRATLVTRGSHRVVEVRSKRFGNADYRVTRVIGGRVREDFAGIRLDTNGSQLAGAVEEVLPVSFMMSGELRYKGYSVMATERSGLQAGPTWSKTCIFCHNTVPYLDRALGALSVPHAETYQGPSVDARIPGKLRRAPEVVDPAGLVDALEEEVRFVASVDGKLPRDVGGALSRTIANVRDHFDGGDLIEQGIGCEACHLGSKEHVADPTVRPSFAPRSSFLSVAYEPGSAEAEVRACAACHQVLFTGYPHTWEGGRTGHADRGGSSINSGEARDFMLGGCASKMRCSTCHDVHAPGAKPRDDDAVCTSCHAELADPEASLAHAKHDAEDRVDCVDCHMPRKNASIATTLTRYHRIGSPTDPQRVHADRPLECALCHADWTVGRTAAEMERLFGTKIQRDALSALYGGLDRNVLEATVEGGKPHEQLVAAHILGQKRVRPSIAGIAALLTHEIPLVRYFARDALEKILGQPSYVDVHADRSTIAAAVDQLLTKLQIYTP